MIHGNDLKAGDVVYESNIDEWSDDALIEVDGWDKTVAIEVAGKIYLTSHADKQDNQHWLKMNCCRPVADRNYGETPQEALSLDCKDSIEYHETRIKVLQRFLAAIP